MDRQQILNLYQWAAGVCFRHPEKGNVLTARIKTILLSSRWPRGGHPLVKDCVIELEQERWVAAGQNGVAYEPGHAGEALT